MVLGEAARPSRLIGNSSYGRTVLYIISRQQHRSTGDVARCESFWLSGALHMHTDILSATSYGGFRTIRTWIGPGVFLLSITVVD